MYADVCTLVLVVILRVLAVLLEHNARCVVAAAIVVVGVTVGATVDL